MLTSFSGFVQSQCPENCIRCRNSWQCLECVDGKYGERCERNCDNGCKKCIELYPGFGYSECIECLPNLYGSNCMFNCSYCAGGLCSRDSCINGCMEGWQEYNRICIKCPSACETCDPWSWNSQKCVSCPAGTWGDMCDSDCSSTCANNTCNQRTGQCECRSGSYLDTENNICMNCPDNCIVCTAASNCTRCKGGEYGSACEHSCTPHCLECTSEPEYNHYKEIYESCTRCEKGYYRWDECFPCKEGCTSCWWMKYSNVQECTGCADGYYWDRIRPLTGAPMQCFRCPTGCKKCNGRGDCLSCFDGYSLSDYTCQ